MITFLFLETFTNIDNVDKSLVNNMFNVIMYIKV